MKRILSLILTLLMLFPVCYASLITQHTTYTTNGQVTSTNLNGNLQNIITVVNGSLDNTNANTSGGFRFYEVVGSLPAAGTQGRCAFLTTDNTFNFDTGSAWNSAIVVSGAGVQGDIIYHNGSAWARLAAGTSGQYLRTSGAGANPSWNTVNLGYTNIAWINFNMSTDAIADSYNVTSITDGAAGTDTINWSITFANTGYVTVAMVSGTSESSANIGTKNTTNFTTNIYINPATSTDATEVNILAIGD